MERIDPIRPPETGAAQVPAIRRLTLAEREQAARERERRRRERRARTGPSVPGEPRPPEEGGGHIDLRA